MKHLSLLLLLLAGCRAARPPQQPYVHQPPAGHYVPGEVMDLDAAPDSITTVVAEQYFLTKKQAKKFLRHETHHRKN